MTEQKHIPIDVAHLLPVLDTHLVELLQSLTPDEWQRSSIAKLWTVKDIAAHLLDTNIRLVAVFRDNYFGEQVTVQSHKELVDFLNTLNADWVKALRRASPQLLILLHQITGPLFCNCMQSLNPFEKSLFAVNWAGETESKNWMEVARNYTEKWLHQQQIRDAVNKPGLMTKELFYPFMDIFMLALPHTYRTVAADNGTTIKVTITTDIGGSWYLLRTENRWTLSKTPVHSPAAEVITDPDTAWKLFSKSLRPADVQDKVTITGNRPLGETVLTMVSVMA